LAGVSARDRVVVAPFAVLKSGALSPAFRSGPIRVIGFPLKVTAAARFSMVLFLERGEFTGMV
jgi:hypothetical protein